MHFCAEHKIENIALFKEAHCPCKHTHNFYCECGNSKIDHSKPHQHDKHNPEFSDDCCSENEINISIKDAFSPSNFKLPLITANELYVLPKFEFALNKSLNKLQNIELKKQYNHLYKPKLRHFFSIYNLSSRDDSPDNFII